MGLPTACRLIIERIATLPFWRKIETFAVVLGIIVDSITLASFIGVMRTPNDSPLFYINSQEFLVWVLIALIYSFGLLNAFMLRRWRRLFRHKYNPMKRFFFMLWKYEDAIFLRVYAWNVVISFPFTFMYARSISIALWGTNTSPWTAFFIACIMVWFVALVLFGVGQIFDAVFLLYSGDGDAQEDLMDVP